MKKLKIVMILSLLFWVTQACNNPDQRRETDDREMPTDNNIDTTDNMGNDTLGAGDAKGPDHVDDIP